MSEKSEEVEIIDIFVKKTILIIKVEKKIMKCLKCKRTWTRTKWYEFISFLTKCKKCGSSDIKILMENSKYFIYWIGLSALLIAGNAAAFSVYGLAKLFRWRFISSCNGRFIRIR